MAKIDTSSKGGGARVGAALSHLGNSNAQMQRGFGSLSTSLAAMDAKKSKDNAGILAQYINSNDPNSEGFQEGLNNLKKEIGHTYGTDESAVAAALGNRTKQISDLATADVNRQQTASNINRTDNYLNAKTAADTEKVQASTQNTLQDISTKQYTQAEKEGLNDFMGSELGAGLAEAYANNDHTTVRELRDIATKNGMGKDAANMLKHLGVQQDGSVTASRQAGIAKTVASLAPDGTTQQLPNVDAGGNPIVAASQRVGGNSSQGAPQATSNVGGSAQNAKTPFKSVTEHAEAAGMGYGAGNYSTKTSGGKRKYHIKKIDFQNTTVGELRNQQDAGKLNAVGHYQMIGTTLKEAVDLGYVKKTDVYNEDTQDKLLAHYLTGKHKRPNLASYMDSDSESGLKAAALDYAKEWASFAKSNGRSYYPGDNSASVPYNEVLKVAQETKKIYKDKLKEGYSKEQARELAFVGRVITDRENVPNTGTQNVNEAVAPMGNTDNQAVQMAVVNQSNTHKTYDNGFTVSSDTRAKHKPSSKHVNISLDFNATEAGTAKGTLVVIPDNASPEVKAGAEQFNEATVAFAAKYGYSNYKNRGVRTRSQNGRGVKNTVHVEPFFNNDIQMQKIIKEHPEEWAELNYNAFKGIKNGRMIAPHGKGRDRGATSSVFENETNYGKFVTNHILQRQQKSPEAQAVNEENVNSLRNAVVKEAPQTGATDALAVNEAVETPPVTDAPVEPQLQAQANEAPMEANPIQEAASRVEQIDNNHANTLAQIDSPENPNVVQFAALAEKEAAGTITPEEQQTMVQLKAQRDKEIQGADFQKESQMIAEFVESGGGDLGEAENMVSKMQPEERFAQAAIALGFETPMSGNQLFHDNNGVKEGITEENVFAHDTLKAMSDDELNQYAVQGVLKQQMEASGFGKEQAAQTGESPVEGNALEQAVQAQGVQEAQTQTEASNPITAAAQRVSPPLQQQPQQQQESINNYNTSVRAEAEQVGNSTEEAVNSATGNFFGGSVSKLAGEGRKNKVIASGVKKLAAAKKASKAAKVAKAKAKAKSNKNYVRPYSMRDSTIQKMGKKYYKDLGIPENEINNALKNINNKTGNALGKAEDKRIIATKNLNDAFVSKISENKREVKELNKLFSSKDEKSRKYLINSIMDNKIANIDDKVADSDMATYNDRDAEQVKDTLYKTLPLIVNDIKFKNIAGKEVTGNKASDSVLNRKVIKEGTNNFISLMSKANAWNQKEGTSWGESDINDALRIEIAETYRKNGMSFDKSEELSKSTDKQALVTELYKACLSGSAKKDLSFYTDGLKSIDDETRKSVNAALRSNDNSNN